VPQGVSPKGPWALLGRTKVSGLRFYLLFMEPGSLVMERKMLLGIKRRTERPRSPGPKPLVH